MRTPSPRKTRAVRLTDEALENLKTALQKEWQRTGEGTRLTRAARAATLGVSIATAERILHQKGNDRAVLVEAFQAVNLPWDDAYAVSLNAEQQTAETPTPQTKPTQSPRRIGFALFIALPILLCLVALTAIRSDSHAQTRHRTYLELTAGFDAYEKGHYQTARHHARKAFEIAQAHHISDFAGNALRLEADALAAQGDLNQALEIYQKARPIFELLPHSHSLGTLLEVTAVTHARLGNFEAAEADFLQAQAILQELDGPQGNPGCLRGLGSLAALRRDFEKARRLYAQALAASKSDERLRYDIRALRALTHRDQGNYDLALAELQTCLAFWQSEKHARWTATTHRQIASVYQQKGNLPAAQTQLQLANNLYHSVGDQKGTQETQSLPNLPKSPTTLAEDYF